MVQGQKRFTKEQLPEKTTYRFIYLKKVIALCLLPLLFGLALVSFSQWAIGTIHVVPVAAVSFKSINNIFFDQFFTVLIIVDVILLLFSFFYTDQFHKVIRNSGFIISTNTRIYRAWVLHFFGCILGLMQTKSYYTR